MLTGNSSSFAAHLCISSRIKFTHQQQMHSVELHEQCPAIVIFHGSTGGKALNPQTQQVQYQKALYQLSSPSACAQSVKSFTQIQLVFALVHWSQADSVVLHHKSSSLGSVGRITLKDSTGQPFFRGINEFQLFDAILEGRSLCCH